MIVILTALLINKKKKKKRRKKIHLKIIKMMMIEIPCIFLKYSAG